MSVIIMIDKIEAKPQPGAYTYTAPQGVMELLSEARRSVEALATKLDQINRGHEVKTTVVIDTDMRTATIKAESRT